MNMNKALQNLYHAVSGETTTKRNITKLLLDIHYAITGKESENKNNHSRIVDSMATNWPEGGGGGGGGSSDFVYTVDFINQTGTNKILTIMPYELDDATYITAVKVDTNGITALENDDLNNTLSINAIILPGHYFIALLQTMPDAQYITTGNAEADSLEGMNFVKITGDGTITIS